MVYYWQCFPLSESDYKIQDELHIMIDTELVYRKVEKLRFAFVRCKGILCALGLDFLSYNNYNVQHVEVAML